jgi:hypothetical protein
MSPRLFLEVGVFVVFFVFLKPFSKIIVEACGSCDQIQPVRWEFLYGYGVFDFFEKAFIKLRHFSFLVLSHSGPVLDEFG